MTARQIRVYCNLNREKIVELLTFNFRQIPLLYNIDFVVNLRVQELNKLICLRNIFLYGSFLSIVLKLRSAISLNEFHWESATVDKANGVKGVQSDFSRLKLNTMTARQIVILSWINYFLDEVHSLVHVI